MVFWVCGRGSGEDVSGSSRPRDFQSSSGSLREGVSQRSNRRKKRDSNGINAFINYMFVSQRARMDREPVPVEVDEISIQGDVVSDPKY